MENFVLSLPTLIMTSINQKYQLLNRAWTGNIFVSRNSLDSLSAHRFQYFFNIYLKCKDAQAFGFCSNSGRKTKALVEQIILEIETDSQPKNDAKNEIIEAVEMTKMYLMQKSLASFLINTPLFSHLLQNMYAEIQPTDFEAVCTSRQEEDVKIMEHTWLRRLKIGDYSISIGLYTIPSHAVLDLIKEYLASTDISSGDIQNLLDRSGGAESEGKDLNRSWDILPVEFEIESHKNKRKESITSNDGEEAPRNFSMEKPLVFQRRIETKEEKKSCSVAVEEKFRNKKYTKSKRDEDEEFLDELFEYTKKLSALSFDKSKKSVEGVDDRLERETHFCTVLKSMK